MISQISYVQLKNNSSEEDSIWAISLKLCSGDSNILMCFRGFMIPKVKFNVWHMLLVIIDWNFGGFDEKDILLRR